MGSGSSEKYDYDYYGYKQARDPRNKMATSRKCQIMVLMIPSFFHKDIT